MSNTILVRVACPLCRQADEVEVPVKGFMRWQAGELIQQAMPELDADRREQLMSGTCAKCWDEIFPPDEDE